MEKAVGYDHVVQIDESHADHHGAEDHSADRLRRRKEHPTEEEECGGEKFNRRIAKAESAATASGPSPEDKPAHYRYIVEPGNGSSTRTMRAGCDYRFFYGNAMDADVQETADVRADKKKQSRKKPGEIEFDLQKLLYH